MQINLDKEQEASRLRGSLLEFIKFFYTHLTGRDFIVSQPVSRISHHITVAKAFTDLFWNQRESHGLYIGMPPGYGKSVMTSMWIAWCFAHHSDCNFLYISYSHDLASKHTAFIKQIMSTRMYKYLFDVEISHDSRAKDKFSTSAGGMVCAYGSTGSITGSNAGAPGLDRFSGCVIMDDPSKPDEIHSESMRDAVKRNYQETILQRPRDVKVPIVLISQRLHEDDLPAYMLSGLDVRKWESIVLQGIDAAGHCLFPEVQPLSYLEELREKQPFVFWSQIQQQPTPASGSLFKPEWFILLDKDPEFIATFIVCDTAETDKNYNDASAFSFFGVYDLEIMGKKTGQTAIHWINALEIRVEPKDLEATFLDFYADTTLHKTPPLMAGIEKKSTGTTLLSVLKKYRGLQIREIERTRASGSKTTRFLEMQKWISSGLVSLTKDGHHTDNCVKHMSKITANNSHKNDDLADNLYDAIKIALIEKTMYAVDKVTESKKQFLKNMTKSFDSKMKLGVVRNGRSGGKTY